MNEPRRITWLPAHPCTGTISMQRYWQELQKAADILAVEVDCPFTSQNLIHQTGRWKRAGAIYLHYPLLASKVSTELVHILDHSMAHLIPFLPSRSKVFVSVHDLFPLVDSAGMTPFQHWRMSRRLKLLTRADCIISGSEFSKNQVIELLGIQHGKIHVILDGYSDLGAQTEKEFQIDLPEKEEKSIFIFSVGNCSARKNLGILPDVVQELQKRGFCPVILRAGDFLPGDLSRSLNEAAGPGNVIEFGRVDDSVLNILYRKSDLLFFPSWAEGFGLPLLEAMGKGCPVVSSNTTSLPEVGGDAVLYFNPSDPVEASEKIILLRDDNVRNRYIHRGFEQIQKFSWEEYLGKLIELYNQI